MPESICVKKTTQDSEKIYQCTVFMHDDGLLSYFLIEKTIDNKLLISKDVFVRNKT